MSIDKRPSGLWRARWRDAPSGPQRSASFPTKKAAQTFLADQRVKAARGESVDLKAAQMPLSDWWEAWASRQVWRADTARSAGVCWARIEPVLGRRPLASLRRSDVQALVAVLLARGLSPSTVRLTVSRLRSCLKAAVLDRVVAFNAADGIAVNESGSGRIHVPSESDIATLLEVATPAMALGVLLGSRAGLRRGETCGLSSDRVDWLSTAPTVTVDRQGIRPNLAGPMVFGEPKTAASHRSVPVPRSFIDELSMHMAGLGLGEHGLLVHQDGHGYPGPMFGAQWRQLTKRAGLEGLRYHDLRHAFCSRLLSAGVSVVAVSRAAGHSTPSVTLNTYGHLLASDEDRIRQALEPGESWLSPERSSDRRIISV